MESNLIILKYFKSVFKFKIDNFVEYHRLIEKSIEQEKNGYSRSTEQEIDTLSKKEEQSLKDHPSEEYWKISEIIPSLHRAAIFLLCYNFLECQLNLLCLVCASIKMPDLEIKDLRGRGIERSKLYFEKVLNITDSLNDDVWYSFSFYNDLRNIIVHNESTVNYKKHREIINKLLKYSGITLSESNEIILENMFIEDFINNIFKLFKSLFEEIDDKIIVEYEQNLKILGYSS